MESLKRLALNAVPLNASVPTYFKEEVRIARIFKQLSFDNTKSLTDEEIQAMELLKFGFIPFGWGRFKLFVVLWPCSCTVGYYSIDKKRDTLQNMMIKFGICKKCNKLLFKPRGSIQYAFSIEKNEVVPVDKMDSGYFNYIIGKTVICESKNRTTAESYNGSHAAHLLIRAFPTVKPMVLLCKESIKINIGCSLQEFFEVNKQWWGRDTTIDEKILQLYKSDIIYYSCTELSNMFLRIDISIKSNENIEKINQMASSRYGVYINIRY
jgi:hypothetical protein